MGNASNGTNGRASISRRLKSIMVTTTRLPRKGGTSSIWWSCLRMDSLSARTATDSSVRYPKLMVAYGSKDSPAALQQRLQDWYERHNETFRQELLGLVDPPEGGMCRDQLPLDKPRAKTPDITEMDGDQLPLDKPSAKMPDITSGAGLPIPEGCSSIDAECVQECVQDGQADTSDV
jgi:hypothetical protein